MLQNSEGKINDPYSVVQNPMRNLVTVKLAILRYIYRCNQIITNSKRIVMNVVPT